MSSDKPNPSHDLVHERTLLVQIVHGVHKSLPTKKRSIIQVQSKRNTIACHRIEIEGIVTSAIPLLAALTAIHNAKNEGPNLGGVAFRRLNEYSLTGTLGLHGGAGPFVKVKHDNPEQWQKLIIDEWDEDETEIPETFLRTNDGETPLLHSELGYDRCIQAGYGQTVHHGTKLRLNDCNEDNELQRWNTNNIHGAMKLQGWFRV